MYEEERRGEGSAGEERGGGERGDGGRREQRRGGEREKVGGE